MASPNDRMNTFIAVPLLVRVTPERLEQHRDVEDEAAVVVDYRATVDDTAMIALRNHDELRLEVHRHRTNSALPAHRQVAASVVVHAGHAPRQRTIVGPIVVANHDHIMRSEVSAVGLVDDDLTATLVMVPFLAGF